MLHRFIITPQQNNTTCNIYYSIRSLVKLDFDSSQSPGTDNRDYKQIGFMVTRPKEPLVALLQIWMLLHTSLFLNDGIKLWPEFFTYYVND